VEMSSALVSHVSRSKSFCKKLTDDPIRLGLCNQLLLLILRFLGDATLGTSRWISSLDPAALVRQGHESLVAGCRRIADQARGKCGSCEHARGRECRADVPLTPKP
jgi:hypothetical protein